MQSEKRQRQTVAAVRLSESETTLLRARAEAHGMTLGPYLRAVALATESAPLPKSRRAPPRDADELRRLLGLLGNVASNLNQIARGLNAGNVPLPPVLDHALAAVAEMRDPMLAALGK